MDTKNEAILSAEEERSLLAPIDQYVGGIQEKINALRVEGTDRVVSLTNHMAIVKENANYTKAEKSAVIAEDRKALEKAKAVEEANRAEIKSLIDEAVSYLDANYDKEYYDKVVASCAAEKAEEDSRTKNTSIKTVSLMRSSSTTLPFRRSRIGDMTPLPIAIT